MTRPLVVRPGPAARTQSFRVGEAIPNLPVGEYTLHWNGQAARRPHKRRRTTEGEIEHF